MDQGCASRDRLVEHHFVKITPAHLPGVPFKELPILIASRDRHEPGAFGALTVTFHPLLGRVLASVHLVGKTQIAENLAASTGHRFPNVIAGKGLRLNNDRFNAFPEKEHRSGRTTGPATYY